MKVEIQDMKRLVRMGECYATNKISQEGMNVGFMYREESEYEGDSGWRFISGTEDEAYMDDPSNMNIFEVNTIANFDPAIIPYLDLPEGTELERVEGADQFSAFEAGE